mmetsp:Transcript_100160/g.287807  ORF Transcript_100160/g.287807 Transcript_100160/m.287807 type:complete len:111 (+) Transcript_100160:317-649(+)
MVVASWVIQAGAGRGQGQKRARGKAGGEAQNPLCRGTRPSQQQRPGTQSRAKERSMTMDHWRGNTTQPTATRWQCQPMQSRLFIHFDSPVSFGTKLLSVSQLFLVMSYQP